MRWLVAASFLLGCLAPPAVAAESVPVDASWHASGAASLRGAWDAGLGLASLEVLPGSGPLEGRGQQGRVEVFEETLVVQEVGGGPQAVEVPPQSDPVQQFAVEGDVTVDGPAKGGFLWVLPMAEGTGVTAHAHGAQARLALGAVEARNPLVRPGFHGRELIPRGGGAELAGPGAVASLDGPLLVVAFGPTVTAAGGQAWTGCRPTGMPPGAPGASPLLTCRYAVLESQRGQWNLSALAVAARVLTLHGTLAGTLAADHVDAASWNGTQLPTQAAIVEATGDFQLDTAFSDGTAVWHVQGTMASLKVDASAVQLVRASTAAGAAGVGAAAWLLRPWLVALYARVRALGGKTRHRILDALKARGGASAGELARSLGLHKTSVEYHLGVLARSGLVARERVANRHHYVATGPGSGATLLGASLGENAVRRAILEALASGPLQTADLVARARLSAGRGGLSLVHYHAGILRGHGLVLATRRRHTYVWSLAAPTALALGAAATPQGGMPVAV